uniref:Uncharacterized protein n=1 Tax=Chromera velia CCMP2878 TaxID=1169474 RepID=A0A0G4FSQ5_9ALVE|eukprot:Cvel_18581.t1-p1 / transcript=Cvel_18581.t1 / gene=Cvel_18581 / organism=Chromera_velia_CCMP2878 / gene_product=hypothetical protein / transcript_product=hypothetical protein / location=Cvel_scaffold1549:31491-37003(+) / protein_length=181 / sequence_SO=supercontig / SO=protein_coding / is_pseudo=false
MAIGGGLKSMDLTEGERTEEKKWEQGETLSNRSKSVSASVQGEGMKEKYEDCRSKNETALQKKADVSIEEDTVSTKGQDKGEEHGLENGIALLKSSDQRSGQELDQGVIAGDRYFAPSSGEGQGKAEKGNSIANIQVQWGRRCEGKRQKEERGERESKSLFGQISQKLESKEDFTDSRAYK